jgi:hypothetical protein
MIASRSAASNGADVTWPCFGGALFRTARPEDGADPKVIALVYVVARAPDGGEDFVALSRKFPTMPVRAGVEERDCFTILSEEAFLKFFPNGVTHEKAEVLYAEQGPTTASLFGGRTTAAALPQATMSQTTLRVMETPQLGFQIRLGRHMSTRAQRSGQVPRCRRNAFTQPQSFYLVCSLSPPPHGGD